MIPRHYELFDDVLEILADGSILTTMQLEEAIAVKKDISAETRAIMLDSGRRPRFRDRVNWAKTYLKAAGLIAYPSRGKTQITDAGLNAFNDETSTINIEYLLKYESFHRSYKRNVKTKTDGNITILEANVNNEPQTPQEQMDSAFSEINAVLKSEILDEIMLRESTFFEKLVVKLLVKMGYGGLLDGEGIVTQATNDEGIDGIIREDKLGFSNIYIQAKRYALDKSIGRPDVQGFVGAVATKEGKRLFITTANFASTAKQYAKENHVVLVDGDKLAELMIEYGVGVSTVQTYEIKKLDSDFFEEQ